MELAFEEVGVGLELFVTKGSTFSWDLNEAPHSFLYVCFHYLLFHLDSLMNEILQRGIVVQLYNVLDLPIETMQKPCHGGLLKLLNFEP